MRESFLFPFSLDSSLEVKIYGGARVSQEVATKFMTRCTLAVTISYLSPISVSSDKVCAVIFALTQRICRTTYTKYWRNIKYCITGNIRSCRVS